MLTDLPEEIIQLIISFLLPGINSSSAEHENLTRQKALTNLLLVNKQLHRICLPSLYHTVDSRDFSWKQLTGVLNAVLRKPELAGYVKVIRVFCWNIDSTWDVDSLRPQPEGHAIDLQLAAVGRIDCSKTRQTQWTRGLISLDQDSQLALLLSLCTSLEVVDLVLPALFAGSLTRAMLCHYSGLHELATIPTPEYYSQKQPLIAPKHAAQGKPLEHHWPSLREVRAAHYDNTSGSIKLRMPSLLPLLLSSPLQTVRLSNMEITNSRDLYGGSFGALKRLYLSRLVLNYNGMTAVLAASPLLQVLSVEWHDNGGMTYSQLGCALRAHGSSLKKLIVKLILKDRVWTAPQSVLSPGMGYLHTLEQLHYLSAPAEALFGEQEMPDDEFHNDWYLGERESVDDVSEADEDMADALANGENETSEVPILNDILPRSIGTLRLTDLGRMDEDLFDSQLTQLMGDEKRASLSKIQLRTLSAFTGDLESLSWEEHQVNQFWKELRRRTV